MSDTFDHEGDAWDDALFGRTADGDGDGGLFIRGRHLPRCRKCHSEDVRWRQQGGRWVLFSSQPGVEHRCPTQPLGAIPEDD